MATTDRNKSGNESGTGDKNRANSSEASTGSLRQDEELNAPSGWLNKRCRVSRRWKKQWFYLKNASLYYGNTEQSATKKISLNLAEIAESSIDRKQNVFRIRPRDCKRIYYMQATDRQALSLWMQAICFAKAASQDSEYSQACVIQ